MITMKYFTINELCQSDTACRLRISNIPTNEVVNNLLNLVDNILDPLREAYGKPIIVNSGYRGPKLNKAVKGSSTSQHVKGLAADIRCVNNSKKGNKELFDLIQLLDLPYDLLINEYDFSWVHVSFGPRNRKQILKIG